MKKVISLIIAIQIIAMCFPFTIAYAAEGKTGVSSAINEEGFRYYKNSDGNAVISYIDYGEIGKTEIVIPETIDGYTVVGINQIFCMGGNGLKVVIPKTVTTISEDFVHSKINEFQVDDENLNYCSVDGVLFSKDMKTLVSYIDKLNSTSSYTVPDGVEILNEYCFAGSFIKKIQLPDTITQINACAFMECKNLKNFKLPASLKVIDGFAFSQCSSLTEVVLPDSLEILGDQVFSSCTALKKLTMSKGIKEIYGRVIDNTLIESLDLPEGLEYIGANAFKETRLKKVLIPSTVKNIGQDAFCRCSQLTEVNILAPIKEIADSTFDTCIKLEKVQLPSTIEKIGDSAFCYTKIKELQLSENLNSIGVYSFYGCTNLGKIYIPKKVTIISDYAFADSGITSLKGMDNVKTIGEYAFSDCPNLVEATIPKSVTKIKEGAFKFCANLKTLKINFACKDIPDGAFEECTNLTRVYVPNNVEIIGKRAFYNCNNLKEIILGNRINIIDPKSIGYANVFDKEFLVEGLTIYGCTDAAKEYAKIAGIKYVDLNSAESVILKDKGVTLQKGKSYTIDYIVNNDRQSGTTFQSTNTSVATVDSRGVVKGVGRGVAYVAVINGEDTASMKVKVIDTKLNKKSCTIYVGEKFKLKVQDKLTTPTYKSKNSKVASALKSGIIKAKKKGNTTITVKTGNKVLNCKVKVVNPKLSKKTVSVKAGKSVSVKIKGKVKSIKNKYTNTKYAAITSKTSAAKLNVKGLKKGSTTLKVKVNGVWLKLKVKVY